MAETTLVSVLIPVYNGADFVTEAIASVRAQVHVPTEIIVIDDGSTDQTAQVVQTLGCDIRYVYQQNQGPAAARNLGLALAQGEFIAFLDADDLWPVDKLAHQVASLATDAAVQVVWGHTQICAYQEADDSVPTLAPTWSSLLGSLLCRASVFQTVGVFEPTLRINEDIDWFLRLQEHKLVVKKSPDLALVYRIRPGSLTYGKSLRDAGWFQTVRRALQRQRALGGQLEQQYKQ